MAARLNLRTESLWILSRKQLKILGSDTFPSILTQLLPSDNLHSKPTPWGTSHLLSHAQHPAESSHSLLEMDVLKEKAVISVKLLVWYENFLSDVWIT